MSHLGTQQHGVTLPCGRKEVQLGHLERLLFSWAFWDLHGRDAIELGYLEDVQEPREHAHGDDDEEGNAPADIYVRRREAARGACGLEAIPFT